MSIGFYNITPSLGGRNTVAAPQCPDNHGRNQLFNSIADAVNWFSGNGYVWDFECLWIAKNDTYKQYMQGLGFPLVLSATDVADGTYYLDNGNYIQVSNHSNYGMSVYFRSPDLSINFNVTMPGSSYVAMSLMPSNVLADDNTVRLMTIQECGANYFRITASAAMAFSADLLNFYAGMSPIGQDTDPYNDLPTPGDQPIPGGGTVGVPGLPGLTATSAGVIGLFAPTAAQMQLLADFMWTDFGGTGTTVEDILQEIVEALKRSISNPLDYIVGLNIIPSQGLSIGASKTVRFGFVSSGVSMPQLANQYFTVDCGTLAFDTLCGDTFLDYAPYSKFSIYLPYIGFKDVDPNDFVGHTIGVIYHGDCVTGGVTAYITKDGSVMYQYSGCCALNVPLSADNWGNTISAAVNVATGIVAAAASGGAAGLATGALKGAASVAANPSLLSPQVSHSGAVSGSAGCMGVQYPFVIREAVNFHSTAYFNKSAGYPAYYYRQLGDVSGFTTVIEPHMSNIPMATQDEIQEIESLLEGGVIL